MIKHLQMTFYQKSRGLVNVGSALISVQIIPSVSHDEDVYEYVDAAVQVIEDAGVTYEVHPLETTMEGEMDELMWVIQKMNEKLIRIGANNIISQIKMLYQPSGITSDMLTEKYT